MKPLVAPIAAIAALSWLGPIQLRAQTASTTPPAPNHLYDRLQFIASGTTVWLGSTIQVNAADGTPGTEIDRGDVGAARQTWEPRLALRWRLGRRHEIDVGYLFVRNSGSRALADTIRFNDTSFAAGLRVNSALKSDQAFLTYRFAFHAGERSQIGAGIGFGALLFNLDLDAVAGTTSGGADTAIAKYSASKGVTAPTGSLGLYGRWRVGDQWYIESDLRGLYLKVDRVHATVFEAGAAGRYFVSRHVGFEVGYGLTGIKVTIDPRSGGGGFSGQLKYTLQNARLGVIATP
jgi:hypothetical protein